MDGIEEVYDVQEITPEIAADLVGGDDPAKAVDALRSLYRVDLSRGVGRTAAGNSVVWTREGRRITVDRFEGGRPSRRFRFSWERVDATLPRPYSWLPRSPAPADWLMARMTALQ